VYPELAVIEKALGRVVTEKDIDNFAIHFTHDTKAPRFDSAATLLFLHTFYRGIVPNIKVPKTLAPATKPSKVVIDNLALAIRFRFNVSVEGALEAAKRYRTSDRTLERELTTQRMLEGKKRKLAAKRAALAAATQTATIEAA
jgi:hypothetical protein